MTNVLPPALILAAGLGTRLRPLTYSRAKAAVPVAGIPLIRRQVTKLTATGIREVVVNLHHRPETIAAASRLPGVTPAALTALMVHLRREANRAQG